MYWLISSFPQYSDSNIEKKKVSSAHPNVYCNTSSFSCLVGELFWILLGKVKRNVVGILRFYVKILKLINLLNVAPLSFPVVVFWSVCGEPTSIPFSTPTCTWLSATKNSTAWVEIPSVEVLYAHLIYDLLMPSFVTHCTFVIYKSKTMKRRKII